MDKKIMNKLLFYLTSISLLIILPLLIIDDKINNNMDNNLKSNEEQIIKLKSSKEPIKVSKKEMKEGKEITQKNGDLKDHIKIENTENTKNNYKPLESIESLIYNLKDDFVYLTCLLPLTFLCLIILFDKKENKKRQKKNKTKENKTNQPKNIVLFKKMPKEFELSRYYHLETNHNIDEIIQIIKQKLPYVDFTKKDFNNYFIFINDKTISYLNNEISSKEIIEKQFISMIIKNNLKYIDELIKENQKTQNQIETQKCKDILEKNLKLQSNSIDYNINEIDEKIKQIKNNKTNF